MAPIQHAPTFSVKDATNLVLELYGLKGNAKILPSERDQNFLIESDSGNSYVFKIANALEDLNLLEAQNRAMTHLAKQTAFCQQVVLTQSGNDISEVYSQGDVKHFVRLLSYLPGIPLGESKRHSNSLLKDLGRCLGQIDRAFTDFDHPAVHRDFYWDLANALKIVHQHCSLIEEEELRQSINKFVKIFENQIVPLFPKLRKSVIHNDANDYNVIVGGGDNLHTRNQQITGLIDFGDMVYSYTV
ncbi:MAG: phosphotransferase, partial [Deltaproteobacteria bacterium]|nr:phosphotransferase [Deltaproteobacteria bacterium]